MNKIVKIISCSILCLFLSACGSGSTNTSQDRSTEFDDNQKDFLYNLFKTEYLWYDEVPSIDYSSYSRPQNMINALKYQAFDNWSYSQTLDEYNDSSNQVTQGFGCFFSGSVIESIQFESPCDTAGLKRGDDILRINDEEAASENYNEALNNLGIEAIFTILRGTQEIDVSITPLKYNYKASKSQIFTRANGVKVGHLILDEFTSSSADEIDTVFTYFKNNNITELIIDLRYNGGGSLNTASILMDKIAAYNNHDDVQMHLKWNENYRQNDSYYHFFKDDNSLDINRVLFLTTFNTASASEMTINALKPFLDVKLIGSTTRGKPVGMQGKINKGLIYWLINFSVYNANDIGEFYSGINVDCNVSDTLDYERTNENDSLLNEALYYIDNGNCS